MICMVIMVISVPFQRSLSAFAPTSREDNYQLVTGGIYLVLSVLIGAARDVLEVNHSISADSVSVA